MIHRLTAALSLAALVAGAAPAAPGPGAVGSQAWDFSLQDLQGQTHTLSSHRGQVVLLFIVGYG
ncbi:MAG TPA: redoxin domain-containing protein [Candidatus Krumholzibacteria bacterium]|nr:redoxin domain-containing protein [Candidatus Krumholzibacteria bacterium]